MVKLESLSPSKRLHAGIKNLEQAFFSTMTAILFHEVIAQHIHADALPRRGWEHADDIVGCIERPALQCSQRLYPICRRSTAVGRRRSHFAPASAKIQGPTQRLEGNR